MNERILQKLEDLEFALWEQGILKKEMLTLVEAACYLNLSKSYMYKMAHYKTVPHYCPNGKRIYFKRSELDQWLQKNRKASNIELKVTALGYTIKNNTL